MVDEGYIKFNIKLIHKECIQEKDFLKINSYRNQLYEKELIGAYDNGIGFGNISIRKNISFIISGSGTGNKKNLMKDDYSQVIDYNILNNYVECKGLIEASSESLSHAIVYEFSSLVQAVVHIHSLDLWIKYLNVLPTTKPSAEYGTVEMAFELKRILSNYNSIFDKETFQCSNDFVKLSRTLNCIVMGGHKEGLIFWGNNLDEVLENIFYLIK